MAQLRCLTVTEEGELLKLEKVKLRGRCVLLRGQILTQAEDEQMQLTVSLICVWWADSSSVIHWMYHLLVAGILLRLWSLYVFACVIVMTPVTGAQVHVIAPVCVLDDFCSNLRLLQCSSKTWSISKCLAIKLHSCGLQYHIKRCHRCWLWH